MLSFREMWEIVEAGPDYDKMANDIFAALDKLKASRAKPQPAVSPEPEVQGAIQAPKPATKPAPTPEPTPEPEPKTRSIVQQTPAAKEPPLITKAKILSADRRGEEEGEEEAPIRTPAIRRKGKDRKHSIQPRGVVDLPKHLRAGEELNQITGNKEFTTDASGRPNLSSIRARDLPDIGAMPKRDRAEVEWDETKRLRYWYDFYTGQGKDRLAALQLALAKTKQEGQKYKGLQVINKDTPEEILARTEVVKQLAAQVTHEDISGAKPGIHRDILQRARKADTIFDQLFNKRWGGFNRPGEVVPEDELVDRLAAVGLTPEQARAALQVVANASIHDSRIPQLLTRTRMQSSDSLGSQPGYVFHLDAERAGKNPSQASLAQDKKEAGVAVTPGGRLPSGTHNPAMREAPPTAAPSPVDSLRIVERLKTELTGKLHAFIQMVNHVSDGVQVDPEALKGAAEEATKIYQTLTRVYDNAISHAGDEGDLDALVDRSEELKEIMERDLKILNDYRARIGLPPVK